MTTPSVAEVVAALRSYADDPYSGGSYTDELRARQAADLLEREHRARTEAERERDDLLATIFRDGGQEAARLGKDAVPTAIKRAAEVIGELAALRNRPCPYVHSSREGTHYCTLPHAAEKELAELRKRVAEAVKVRAIRQDDGLSVLYAPMLEHCQRVAILPLREGE